MTKIRVPATSANIGPGFDCLGIAFNLYNTYIFSEIKSGFEIEGCSEEFKNEDNLVYKSMKRCFEKIGYNQRGIKIKMQCEVPVSRGLGSSAACILAGVAGANVIAGGRLDRKQILEIATEIEGHPDNLSPALYGGMTVSVKDEKGVYSQRLELSEKLKFCALIPDFTLSTEKSRSILPKEISLGDAVFNIGRAALLIKGLGSGNYDDIKMGCEDRLHQQYRGKLIRNYSQVIGICREKGAAGVFLSGAGPTIMTIIDRENNSFADEVNNKLSAFEDKWMVKELFVDNDGILIEE